MYGIILYIMCQEERAFFGDGIVSLKAIKTRKESKRTDDMQSLDQIWESVLSILQEKSTRSVYDLWFKDLRLVYLDGDKAAVVINSDLKKDIIQKRYAQPLTEALCEVIGFDPPITVLSDEQERSIRRRFLKRKSLRNRKKRFFRPWKKRGA